MTNQRSNPKSIAKLVLLSWLAESLHSSKMVADWE